MKSNYMILCLILLIGCQNQKSLEQINRATFSLQKDKALLIDTRMRDTYLGWVREQSQYRQRGHLKGSESFPVAYLKKVSSVDIQKWINQVASDYRLIILVDEDIHRASLVAKVLSKFYKNDIKFFDIRLWNDPSQLEYEPSYSLLVPSWWVHQVIEGQMQGIQQWHLFHVGASKKERAVYQSSHLPKAVFISPELIEHEVHFKKDDNASWVLNSDESLMQFAKQYGLNHKDTAILYGSKQDMMAVYRMAVILRYLGVRDVRVMEESPQDYQNAGYSLSQKEVLSIAAIKTDLRFQGRRFFMPFEQVEELVRSKEYPSQNNKWMHTQLIDVRSDLEWRGVVSGYSYFKKKGRIRHTQHSPSGKDAYSVDGLQDIAGYKKDSMKIRALWKTQGINPDNRLIFFCGSGWRGAEAVFYSWVGESNDRQFSRVLYSNGWQEFSQLAEVGLIDEGEI